MTTYNLTYDVVVYGGWSGNGVAEALYAAGEGCTVALVVEGKAIGGQLVTALPKADIGDAPLVQTGAYYNLFVNGTGERYGVAKSYDYEPHVAQNIVLEALGYAGVIVYSEHPLQSVSKAGIPIDYITTTYSGDTYNFYATIGFSDASHEGDLMQKALVEGTDWMVGRESSATYGEAGAGYNRSPITKTISPYVSPGTLYPQVRVAPALAVGDADTAIQNAAYRVTLSNQSGVKIAWSAPPGYNAADYALESLLTPTTGTFAPGGIAPGVFCSNDNVILLNTDAAIGTVGLPLHWFYPKATYAQRRTIETTIKNWQKGKYYFFATDPSRAGTYQDTLNQYGLSNQEYTGNSYWPYLYFREGARLIGQYVVAQQNTQNTNPALGRSTTQTDSIAPCGYSIDIHFDQFITNGVSTTTFIQEGSGAGGDLQVPDDGWAFPYRAALPAGASCTNLVVTTCASVSHVAWGSFREFWQPYSVGAAMGVALGLCKSLGVTLNTLDPAVLRARLRDYWGFNVDPFWNNSVLYYVDARRQNKGKTYICTQQGTSAATGGGPTGTGTGIVDGTCLWDYTAT